MSINVLFVCLGNICRSPMAEGVFQHLVDEAGLGAKIKVDSAATGSWHVGEKAHRGTQHVLSQHGIRYSGRARQVTNEDMANPDAYVIAMDESNITALQRRYGRHPNLHRLLDFASETTEKEIPDPYYTGNFEYVYQLVRAGCRGLLATIREREGL